MTTTASRQPTTAIDRDARPRFDPAELPRRLRGRPLDRRGFPVPAFVQWFDGEPDFRVVDTTFFVRAVRFRLCWLCGQALGSYRTAVVGPMCVVNRITSEPPSHRDCARFAARACPFLSTPCAVRRTGNLPAGCVQPVGIHAPENPGIVVLYTATAFTAERFDRGYIFTMGAPTSLEWWSRGRLATADEAGRALEAGVARLRAVAEREDGPAGVAALEALAEDARRLLPAA